MSKWSFACAAALLLSIGCANSEPGAQCSPACTSLQTCCDGMCVFTQTDANHCGACGATCAGACNSGVCVPDTGGMDASTGGADSSTPQGDCSPTCAASQRCCGTTCVGREQPSNVDGRPASPDDMTSPFNNCNGCGIRCDPERASSCSTRSGGTVPECACGAFMACQGSDICAMTSTGLRCVNTSTDPQNCGEVGHACAEGETCSGGVCGCGGAPCAEGQACCGGACVDTTMDAMNCGGCGTVCGANAPNCVDSACVCGTGAGAVACTVPSMSDIGQSCCDGVCVDNGPTSCGCGVMCDGEDSCIYNSGLLGMGGGGVCCGQEFLPGFGTCSDFGFGDGGLPFPP